MKNDKEEEEKKPNECYSGHYNIDRFYLWMGLVLYYSLSLFLSFQNVYSDEKNHNNV
jgi:hypothetical protein